MQGYLIIADISEYTRFLTSSELEHAQGPLYAIDTGAELPQAILHEQHDPIASMYQYQIDRLAAMAGEAARSAGVTS